MRPGDLDALAAFAAIARARSFTRAAATLGVSPSALSHLMRGLEGRVGVRLLARTTRSVAPTEAGARLLQSVEPALGEIGRGLSALADWQGEPSGHLRLTTFGYAARTVLAPALPSLLLAHPRVTAEVTVEDRLVDLVADRYDAGVRLGDSVEGDMVAVPVGPPLRIAVVGTPGYFARHSPPDTPTDLARHCCVNYRLLGGGGLLPWEFERDGKGVRIRAAGQLVVNDEGMAAAAVRAGAGLGYMMEPDVRDDIARGELVRVLGGWCPPFAGCHLFYPSRQLTPALRALVDALRWKRP